MLSNSLFILFTSLNLYFKSKKAYQILKLELAYHAAKFKLALQILKSYSLTLATYQIQVSLLLATEFGSVIRSFINFKIYYKFLWNEPHAVL